MKHLHYFLLLLAAASFASCNGTKIVTCTNGALHFLGAGLRDADYAGAIAVKYKPDSLFDTPLDTANIIYFFEQHGTVTSDTANIEIKFKGDNNPLSPISASYDYIIIFPATGKRDSISNIRFLGITSQTFTYSKVFEDKAMSCSNPIISYTYNDSTIAGSDATGEFYFTK